MHLPLLPFGLDPLIKEAKRRMRRRRMLLTAVLAGVAALAVGLALGLRPSGDGTPRRTGGATSAHSLLPKDRLIVLDRSIGPVRLYERRESVEKALGRRVERPRGDHFVAYYFGGRLEVTYGDHGVLKPYVVTIRTTWPGFHTRSGLEVGASAASLNRDKRLRCFEKYGWCMSASAAHQLFDLHHAEPSPQTTVLFRRGVITGFGIQ